MKTKRQIQYQLRKARNELRYIEQNIPAGNCHWRMTKRYVDALEWVLE